MKIIALFSFLICMAITPSAAWAQEYFGRFLDSLRGGFNAQAKPRPTFRLESNFRFDDPNGLQWVAPAGIEVDGASIPQLFWSFIGGPFEGSYINASVIHDHYCRTKSRTAHDTHRNFYYGMRAAGVERWRAEFMYWAVSTFGPSWKLEPRVVLSLTCTASPNGAPTCVNTPKFETALVTIPSVDLSDPEVLSAAIGKATAVARTLRTSDGKVLDIGSKGPVLATLENIQANGTAYRTIFTTKNFYGSTSNLGLLSNVEENSDIATVQPWENNKLPKFSETWVLTPRTVNALNPDLPFKVDARSAGLLVERAKIGALE